MHSGEEKVTCSRYKKHNQGLNDGTPRPSSAFRLTHRKTSPASHLHTPHNKHPGVRHVTIVRESVSAVPRVQSDGKQKSFWRDKQEHFTHDDDVLQLMNKIKALSDEISDLKQLLHYSNQQINKMKVRETEMEDNLTDEIYELQQKNSELQKLINQNDEQEKQYEKGFRRLAEENANLKGKVAELQSKLTEAETTEEAIRAELANEKTKYKKELFKLQQTSANMEPSVKQLITENDQLKTVNKHLEKVAVEIGSRFDSIKTNYNREKAELEDTKTRLQEISEDNRSKDNQVFEFRTKLEHTERKFQEARMNDEQIIQDLETEKSKLESWYDSELSTYKQLKADLEKRVHELSKENHTLKEISKEGEKRSSEDIMALKNLLRKTETELEENKGRLRINDSRSTTVLKLTITNLEQANHKLKTHKELVDATNIEMKEQIRLLQHKTDTEINRLRKEICELEINLKKSSLELDGYKRRHQNTEQNMASLKSQLTKALHDWEETEHTLENYKRDISTYQQTDSNLNNQVDEMSKENERLKDKLNVEKNRLNKQLHMKETEIQKMKTELDNLNARYSQEKLEKKYLTSQLKEAQENLQQTKHRIEENGKVKNKLERDMGEINSQLSRKDTEKQKMETELANIKSRFSTEKQNMKADIDDLKSQLRVAEETLLNTRKTIKENTCTLENEKYNVSSKFEEDISKYQQRVSDLKALNDTLTKENEDLRIKLDEDKKILRQQIYNRETELQNKERDMADLKSQLRVAKETRFQTLQNKETQLANSLARHSDEKTGMKQEIENLKSELTALQTQFSKQEQDTAKMYTLEREREKNEKELSQLREAKTSLEKQLKKLLQANENYKKDNERQRQLHEHIDGDRELLQNQLHDQKIELGEKETELNNIQRRYSEQKANTKQEIDDLKLKLTETKIQFAKEKQELEKTINTLENEIEDYVKEVSRLSETKTSLEEEKQKVTEQLNILGSGKQQSANEISWLQQTKISLEKQIEQLRQENDTYKMDINHQRQIHEKKDDERTDIQRQLYQKETELTDIKRRYSEEMKSTKQEMDDLKSKVEEKMAKEKQERLNFENEKQSRSKEITQLQRTISSLEQQIEQLRQENKKYEKDIDHQRQMNEKTGSNNADIQRQLRHKEKQLEKKETELNDIKRRYSEEMSSTKHEIDDLKSKAKMTKEKQERLNFLENEMQCRGKEITQLQQTITSLEQQIEQLRQTNEKYKTDIDHQRQLHGKKSSDASLELRDTQSRLQTLSEEHERKLVEISELRSRLEELEQTSKRAYEKVNRQERENASIARESSDLDKRIKDITAENDALRSNLKEARSRQQKEEQARKDYESMVSKLQKDKHKLESCKADQEATINQMRNEISTLKKTRGSKQTAGYSDSDYDDLYRQFRRQEKQLKEVENELEDTKTRLSKCMGDQLTNNNPNIVDLSDMNRPSKLADRYKELYDNQWTDAYEILEKSVGAEEQIIKILLDTLIETKRFCDHHTEMEMDHILTVITRKDKWQQSDVPVGVIKYIKDCRKSTVSATMKIKYKEYVDDLKKNQSFFVKHALRIDAYLLECFEVCWLMAIQDPPVVLAPVSKQGDAFKADLYSAYTVTGKIVDYVVWPALLLHTNGPTLTKGVAQGMRKSGSR